MQGIPERLTPEMLRRFRHYLNCTQEEMATLLGIRKVTWGRWERGEDKPLHTPMLLYALEYLAFKHQFKQPLKKAHHSAATNLETDYWKEKTERLRVRHARGFRGLLEDYRDLEENPIT